MNRNRVNYQAMALVVGPATYSGESYLTPGGQPTNDSSDTNYNLLRPIDRIQSFGYSLNVQRSDVAQLGKTAFVNRPIITSPTVNISFDYVVANVRNEARIGFYVNHPIYGNSGAPIFPDNFDVNLLAGFTERDLTKRTYIGSGNYLSWPMAYRDKRNFYLVTAPVGEDVYTPYFVSGNKNPNAANYQVTAFGNCYITNYSTSASVGSVPMASVNYLAENIGYTLSGNNVPVPTVMPKRREMVTGINFYIPPIYKQSGIAALKPGDITIDISSTGNPLLKNFGFRYSDIKIQSYQIGLDMRREDLHSVGFKLPWDREIDLPVVTNLSFGLIPGDNISGSFVDLINQDYNYNITIKLKDGGCGNSTDYVRYDFRGAKFDSQGSTAQIGPSNQANFSFTTEIDPQDLTKGVFFSGLLDTNELLVYPNNYLLIDDAAGVPPGGNDGLFLLLEDGSRIILETPQIY